MNAVPDQPPTIPLDAEPADVLEQTLDAVPAEPQDTLPGPLDAREADPADVLEQQRDVPVDDEERDPPEQA